MKIKSLVVTAVLATAILCFGSSIQAMGAINGGQEGPNLNTDALIAQLQAQIQSLMQQIAALQAQQGGQTWCHAFGTSLGYSNSGSTEVGYLHTALDKEGISYSPDTGNNYGEPTMSAIVQFQQNYGLPQTGYVGAMTKVKLNSLYGCKNTVCPQYVTQVCGSNGTTYSGNSCLGYKDASGNPMPPGVTVAIQGACTTATPPSNSLTAICTGLSYPNGGSGAGAGGVSWHASASGGSGQYTYHWILYNDPISYGEGSAQSYSWMVMYGSAGTKQASVNVSDGVTAITVTCSATVGSTSVQPSITVTSPNGGETWNVGETHNITWTASGLPVGAYVGIGLYDHDSSVNTNFGVSGGMVPASQGSFAWTVPATLGMNMQSIVGNQNKIALNYVDSNNIPHLFESANYFTIASASTQPSITSITPTQGSAGTVVTVNGSNLSGATTIEFYAAGGQLMGSFGAPNITAVSANSITFTISGLFAANMTPGLYQVGVVTNACAGGCDSNRIGFTLTAQTTSMNVSQNDLASISSAFAQIVSELQAIFNK